jgi:hypothetical protein
MIGSAFRHSRLSARATEPGRRLAFLSPAPGATELLRTTAGLHTGVPA